MQTISDKNISEQHKHNASRRAEQITLHNIKNILFGIFGWKIKASFLISTSHTRTDNRLLYVLHGFKIVNTY